MPPLDRRISLRGARFWIEDGTLMFCNALDASTRDGPRPATAADRDAHPDAFARDEAGAVDPLKPAVQWVLPEGAPKAAPASPKPRSAAA